MHLVLPAITTDSNRDNYLAEITAPSSHDIVVRPIVGVVDYIPERMADVGIPVTTYVLVSVGLITERRAVPGQIGEEA